jgi:hypothetical protein
LASLDPDGSPGTNQHLAAGMNTATSVELTEPQQVRNKLADPDQCRRVIIEWTANL